LYIPLFWKSHENRINTGIKAETRNADTKRKHLKVPPTYLPFMFESFMYKKLNIFLLLLMCVVVIALAGTSIFFQDSFRSLNNQYQDTSKNYTTASQSLQRCQNTLNEKAEKLNSTSLDIRKYDELYTQKTGELDTTKNKLLETDAHLKEEQNLRQKAEQNYQQALIVQSQQKQQISQLSTDINGYKAQIDQLKLQLSSCQAGN